MPNHVHGILKIDNGTGENATNGGKFIKNDFVASVGNDASAVETPNLGVSTADVVGNQTKYKNTMNTNKTTKKSGGHNPQWKPGTLGVIINQFKRQCTIMIRRDVDTPWQGVFTWQIRFYDHIIRNEKSLNNIRAYIKNNPKKWDRDRNNRNDIWM
ncbi:hypothetical protein KAJ89_02680 [Candidatus Parcubacteria bacterium]|nr:hypothetical protein [Candidatus Parcubacteria bacterium]